MDDPSSPPGAPAGDRRRLVVGAAVGVAVLLVVALLVVGLANRDQGTSIRDAVARGERVAAPDLTLPVLTAGDGVGPVGAPVALTSLRGRPVLVNVWASWCIPCRDEAPVLQDLADDAPGDLLVLGIDVQDVSRDARGFIDEFGLTYPSLRDGSGTDTQRAFETTGVPESFLIDPEGRIAWRHIGPVGREQARALPGIIAGL